MLYPQQNDIRNVLDLSGFWDFRLDPEEVGEGEGWFKGLDALRAPRAIAVPASWNEQFQDTRDYLGAAWYARECYVPQGWLGERVFLRVGSANYAAKVWVNGAYVGAHEGGHLPFAFEVTDKVAWGAPNLVVLLVENELQPTRVPPGNVQGGMGGFRGSYPATSYDFFPYGGLHRPVILYAVPEVHIEDVTVVTEIEGRAGIVRVQVVQSGATGAGKLTLDGAGAPLEADLTFAHGVAEATIPVPEARLWCPDDPYLYKLTVTLVEEGQVLDRYALEVGIRTIAVEGDQILLNGEPIFMTGFGRHEDFPIHGRGLNMPLIVKDYALLKWVGANSYRTSHYPYAEEQMQMADREGILVIDESPAVGLSFDDGEENIGARLAQCKQQMAELIARDKNHPSAIMWSVANEPFPPNMRRRFMGGGGDDSEDNAKMASGTAFFRELFDLTRRLDPTRLTTVVSVMGVGGPMEWVALGDVGCINRYWGWYTQGGQIEEGAKHLAQELDDLHGQLGKPIVITEFGADTIAGMHSDPPEMWTEEYQVAFLRAYLDVAAERPYVAGLHVWNYADFKTAQGAGRAGGLNHKGVFTRDRRPKMAAHFLRERWTREGAHVPATGTTAQPEEGAEAPTPAPGFGEILAGVARKLAEKGVDRAMTIQFDLGEEGVYRLVMAGTGACHVEEGAGAATATLRMTSEDAIDLLRGTLSPRLAFATGKVKVEGDLGTLMALRELRAP